MHFKILVVFAFTLHLYLHLCKATNLYHLFTIIFYWSKATFMVYLKKFYIYTGVSVKFLMVVETNSMVGYHLNNEDHSIQLGVWEGAVSPLAGAMQHAGGS